MLWENMCRPQLEKNCLIGCITGLGQRGRLQAPSPGCLLFFSSSPLGTLCPSLSTDQPLVHQSCPRWRGLIVHLYQQSGEKRAEEFSRSTSHTLTHTQNPVGLQNCRFDSVCGEAWNGVCNKLPGSIQCLWPVAHTWKAGVQGLLALF